MARPRQFDEEAVLAAATQRFWRQGYEATSVRDLATAMGLTTASLYNAFGDKRALYRTALERYAAAALAGCAAVFEGRAAPLAALEIFFGSIVEEALADTQFKGCLVVNTALEVAPHDEAFRDAVAAVFERIERYLRDCVAAGQRDGSIQATQPPEDLAKLLLGAVLGLRVLARTRPDPDLLHGLTRPLFTLLRAR